MQFADVFDFMTLSAETAAAGDKALDVKVENPQNTYDDEDRPKRSYD